MDLLSRLIAGSSAASPTKQKLNTPQERLQACKRICTSLQQIWRNGTRLSDDSSASGQVAGLLNRLNTILQDESRKAAPHSCLFHAASTQIYIIVTKLALSSDSPAIISEATQFFHLLIDGEADGMLDSKIFARALIDLVRRSTIFATIVVDAQGEADLVELLFEIATKIRLDPNILPGWFYPERDQGRGRSTGSEARRSQFPLFYLLVDYVHQDGSIGDFARTGLLYLTETASRSKPFERWMIESDLAPQMASGLSALYSRLSRQSSALTIYEKNLPIVSLSDALSSQENLVEANEDAQESIRAFLSYLAFWQDTLNHCRSVEVRDTLLDHFQVLFVQQLLYPSLLESSDVAGGSTSAVILHLYRILDTVDHQPLLKRMLQYLLSSTRAETKQMLPKHSRARMSMSRQQSMEQLASLAEQANSPSPHLFNLLDLLVFSLHSKHRQTVDSSLKLVTIILRRHHQHVLTNIFASQQVLSPADDVQNLNDFNESLMRLFDLSSSIAMVHDQDQSYEAALNDSRILLERHSCLLARGDSKSPWHDTLQNHLFITSDCKLFGSLSDLLESFFANETITNITLTETLVALATCEFVSMKLWATSHQQDSGLVPASIYDILEDLVSQVSKWKTQFSEWDTLVEYQRSRLIKEDIPVLSPDTRSLSIQSRSSNSRQSPRIKPADQPSTPGASATPRGRPLPPSGFHSINGALASTPKTGASPAKNITGSPLRQAVSSTGSLAAGNEHEHEDLQSKVPPDLTVLKQEVTLVIKGSGAMDLPVSGLADRLRQDDAGSGTSTPNMSASLSGTATPSLEGAGRTTATLGHIIINAIILQEFILEIAALLQIRAAMFDEVDLA